jgi:transposase
MTLTTLTMERAHDEAMDGEPTLPQRPRRRSFTAAYKLNVLERYDRCAGDGDKGALLRREGLYSSHLVEWRRARDAGALLHLGGKAARPRRAADQAELSRTRKRAERAEAKLAKARQVIEIQGKVSALLEQLLAETNAEPKQSR